jgi:hypothetical protein
LENIRPKGKELGDIHELWLSGWKTQIGAFNLMLSAIEASDRARFVDANDRLEKAQLLFRDFQDKLNKYRERF